MRDMECLLMGLRILLTMFYLLAAPVGQACAARNAEHVYATGNVMEIDRCASAWLIKRYIDNKAVFRFYPPGILITEGKAFDRPEGDWHRTHDRATFEIIARAGKINNSKITFIGNLIHDMEVNFWGNKSNPETMRFASGLRRELAKGKTCEDKMQRCFAFLSRYTESLPDEDQ